MALTRKFLSAMGIEEDKIDEIINAHTETVNGLKEEIDKHKAEASKLPAIQKELDEAKTAMANGDKSPYKVKYEEKVKEFDTLKKEYDDYKTDISNKETHAKKVDAYKKLLKDAGVNAKRIDAILKVSNLDKLEFDEEGKVKDADKHSETIKSEWADFIVKEGEEGAKTPNPPANNGGSSSRASVASQRVAKFNADRYGTQVQTQTKEE